ncbi:MAG TPA: hypothetical protein VL125_12385 [Pelobium sp.]|nr:hypothetical protein [Pelobium sp.]
MLIIKSGDEESQNKKTNTLKKINVTAEMFLGLDPNDSPYYKSKDKFATTFNSMNSKEQKHFEQFLLLTNGGYPMTNFLEEKVGQNSLPYYWLKFDKFGGAKVEIKVVLDDIIRQLVNDVHDGKVRVNFKLDDLIALFGQ